MVRHEMVLPGTRPRRTPRCLPASCAAPMEPASAACPPSRHASAPRRVGSRSSRVRASGSRIRATPRRRSSCRAKTRMDAATSNSARPRTTAPIAASGVTKPTRAPDPRGGRYPGVVRCGVPRVVLITPGSLGSALDVGSPLDSVGPSRSLHCGRPRWKWRFMTVGRAAAPPLLPWRGRQLVDTQEDEVGACLATIRRARAAADLREHESSGRVGPGASHLGR